MVEGHQGAPRKGRGRPVSQGGAGHKTKRMLGNRGGRQRPSPPFQCALCQLQVNSETQLKQVGEGRPGLGGHQSKGRRGDAYSWMDVAGQAGCLGLPHQENPSCVY